MKFKIHRGTADRVAANLTLSEWPGIVKLLQDFGWNVNTKPVFVCLTKKFLRDMQFKTMNHIFSAPSRGIKIILIVLSRCSVTFLF